MTSCDRPEPGPSQQKLFSTVAIFQSQSPAPSKHSSPEPAPPSAAQEAGLASPALPSNAPLAPAAAESPQSSRRSEWSEPPECANASRGGDDDGDSPQAVGEGSGCSEAETNEKNGKRCGDWRSRALVMAGGFTGYLVCDCISWSFSLFFMALLDHFGRTKAETSFAGGLLLGCPQCFALFVCTSFRAGKFSF